MDIYEAAVTIAAGIFLTLWLVAITYYEIDHKIYTGVRDGIKEGFKAFSRER